MFTYLTSDNLIWCCGIMKAYPDFFPRKTWGSLIGDKNRYIRNEWDNKLCNDLVGSSKGEKCKGWYFSNSN